MKITKGGKCDKVSPRQTPDIYLRVYMRILSGYVTDETARRQTWAGVKFIGLQCRNALLKEMSADMIDSLMRTTNRVKAGIAHLTVKDFIQMFPPDKNYNGRRDDSKDYFSTMQYIRSFEQDEAIGKGRVDELICEYSNEDIKRFVLAIWALVDKVRERHGLQSMAAEFMQAQGVSPVAIYKDNVGEYAVTGGRSYRIHKTKKRLPRGIKIIR